jgi:sterol desaturase/sphingolipid hydroxylase (fatty acid hydroxylase superfamily)
MLCTSAMTKLDDDHEYEERTPDDMTARFFRIGEGRISGYLASFLGVMSFLAVLCFRYPSYLTTVELREMYDVEMLRQVLMVAMWTSLAFAGYTFVRGRKKRMGAVGILFTAGAFALGGYEVATGDLSDSPVVLGMDWMLLDLLAMATFFIFIEKLLPKYPEQAILRPEWKLDLTYFCINHLFIGVVLLVSNGFAPSVFGWAVNAQLQAFVSESHIAIQLLLLIVCADLVQYGIHRALHEIPALWRIHAVHHSVENMDWLAGSRIHLLETLVLRALIMVPLYLLGPDRAALDAYVIFAALQTVFIHANVAVPFGPLKYLIATPQFHHWHHSSDTPAIDTNYAVHLPVLDLIFGTFHLPARHWPEKYGTTNRLPRTLWAQFKYPFVW